MPVRREGPPSKLVQSVSTQDVYIFMWSRVKEVDLVWQLGVTQFLILHYYEGWNFNFGKTPLDWIQELLE